MFFNLFILSIILVALFMLALGMKILFDPKAEITIHSCHPDEPGKDNQQACSHCEIKDIVKQTN